jgi:hypothetical protein
MSVEWVDPKRFMEATTQSVSWFHKRLQNNELILSPPYQRNPVWQTVQKSYLIDTILRAYPVPELYMQTVTDQKGDEQHTVVDGQQRIRACLEFIEGRFEMDESHGPWGGLSFDQLGEEEKTRIFGYKFVVRTLPQMAESEVREIFARLNRNNIVLNMQELRHATYWGEFIQSMTLLSQRAFWVRSGLFSSAAIRRMLDIEYVSELAIAVLHGPQNKKTNLDRFYAAYEEDFPERPTVEETFDLVLGELGQLLNWSVRGRWSKRSDFYTLFLVLADRSNAFPLTREVRDDYRNSLVEFYDLVDEALRLEPSEDSDHLPPAVVSYARAVQRAASDVQNRRVRQTALGAYLGKVAFVEVDVHRESGSLLDALPTIEELRGTFVVEEEEEEEEEE